MPIFMDTHEGTTDLPAELRRKVTDRIRSGERDSFGVVDRGIIIDREGRKLHCVLDAPDVEAVRKHHEALNVPVERETIHQADVILKG
jgi:hypothetical protein